MPPFYILLIPILLGHEHCLLFIKPVRIDILVELPQVLHCPEIGHSLLHML